ncbi:transmembrane amino acid transporter protein-domain-containing protein [Penicillium concentricum]|uniref:Transmembrane amino acid transporter protein-domain-containing protein n=1 Tax=Penicillium concentricum TaxID=293559 RepID=A0A9W9RX35_9EURO|nr:transmembrane amino acid transporter protein-domain-containing protein [Penicillium concentricum]KAJ5365458.1 transmembrane amino acid transporter protein-domain-containing protein [Penicillium concentricum]
MDQTPTQCSTNAADKAKTNDMITPAVSYGIGDCNVDTDLGAVEKQKTVDGIAHFHRLGWKRLTVVLIVEAIALGSLGLPAAFATLGMIPSVIINIATGLFAIHASLTLGQVKLKYLEVAHYADVGRLVLGKFGHQLFSFMFVALFILLIGSHCLTGTIALEIIAESNICSLLFGIVSAIILLILAIPPSFAEVAILGYIDFISIILAIGITIIATGIQQSPDSLAVSSWSPWPKENLTFSEAFIAVNNIVFAYAFATAQPSFMDEMHTPEDYSKSIWSLGIIQIIIYTLTGATIYAFVGQDVKSPALLSAGPLISKVAFGIALPVIFISGSINTTVVCRYLHGLIYRNSVVRYINTRKGWITWLALIFVVTLIAWVIAEAIPFFSELLSISSSLFSSGFCFYIPPILWFALLKDGKWYSKKNFWTAILNGIVFVFGIVVLICGAYASINGLY